MDRDDVIRMARQAGFGNYVHEARGMFEAFASLVAAHEREGCAKACEEVGIYDYDDPSVTFIEAIRQRGSAD